MLFRHPPGRKSPAERLSLETPLGVLHAYVGCGEEPATLTSITELDSGWRVAQFESAPGVQVAVGPVAAKARKMDADLGLQRAIGYAFVFRAGGSSDDEEVCFGVAWQGPTRWTAETDHRGEAEDAWSYWNDEVVLGLIGQPTTRLDSLQGVKQAAASVSKSRYEGRVLVQANEVVEWSVNIAWAPFAEDTADSPEWRANVAATWWESLAGSGIV